MEDFTKTIFSFDPNSVIKFSKIAMLNFLKFISVSKMVKMITNVFFQKN